MKSRAKIPTYEVFCKMSREEVSALTNAIAKCWDGDEKNVKDKEYTQRGLEWISDMMLRRSRGWESDAYSENYQTGRNRRIVGHEIQISQLERPDVISVPISDSEVKRIIAKAAKAGLNRTQQLVYTFYEAGFTQEHIANILDISQQAVSKQYSLALEKLKYCVAREPAYIFYLESHRKRIPLIEGEVEEVEQCVDRWQALRTDVGIVEWYERS